MLSPRDKDVAALRRSLFLAWGCLCVPVFGTCMDAILSAPLGELKRCRAVRATMVRENSFAQKQVKLLCEKAKAEMSDAQCPSRRNTSVPPWVQQ